MNSLTRRDWLAHALRFVLGAGFPLFFLKRAPSYAAGQKPSRFFKKSSIGDTFAYETMTFKAGFLFFPHAGDAKISLVPLAGKRAYRATLWGKTRGIIGFFTRHREDTHISELEENGSQTRFICKRLIRDTKIGKNHTIKIFEMDYEKKTLTIIRLKKNRKSIRVKPIPEGTFYDDPVTAFYNFRFGSYGPVTYGKTYKIDTIPGKKLKHIHVRVASKEETEKKRASVPFGDRAKYLIRLRIAPEIIKSKKGEIEGWASASLVPIYGVAKDVILFGDVEGTLVQRQKLPVPSPPL